MKFSLPFLKCFSSSSQTPAVNEGEPSESSAGGQTTVQNFPVFSYNELETATQGFRSSNKLGEGHIASVYKGRLQDGSLVAVKVLALELESMRGEREFISEIAALCDIRHENLVALRGCCVDGAKRLLVYDYMPNNSLAKAFLGEEHNRSRFSWKLRKDIAIGVARGFAYLHEEIKPHIVHRDIKARNILLDGNLTPKVGDFGLAKLFRDSKMTHLSTAVAGTFGYLAPEYAISGHLTRKSDVYSFGVLLLEIVSGRAVVGFDIQLGEQFLVDKAWEAYKAQNLLQMMVDPLLKGDFPEEEAIRFLIIGLLCVQEITRLRPNMSSAVKMLTNEFDIGEKEISKPGRIASLMDVKIGNNKNSNSFSSGESTTMSTSSPQRRHRPPASPITG